VINPEYGQPFTKAGAWAFIAHVLEERHDIPIEPVILEHPAGSTGYAMLIPLGERVVYIKLQLGAGQIIGRSFHYSHT
jgi:hypothetical protein